MTSPLTKPILSRALLKRAEALKNGDDIGLEALAQAAIEAQLSLPRMDKLAARRQQGSRFRPPCSAVKLLTKSATSSIAKGKPKSKPTRPLQRRQTAARQAAIEAEKAAREAERERLWQACRDIATAPNLLNRMALLSRQVGVIGEVSAIKGSYIAVTSRLMRSDAISILRRGAPSGGKNFLFAHVTALIPEESLITVTGAIRDRARLFRQR